MSQWRRRLAPHVTVTLVAWLFATCASPQGNEHRQANGELLNALSREQPHEPSAYTQCLDRRQQLEREAPLPGTPQLDAARAEVVARARSAEVLFFDTPKPGPASARVEQLRKQLYESQTPWPAFHQAYLEYQRKRDVLRQILLTDGYLYADKPAAAALLGNHVVLNHLFDARELVVIRGSQLLHAVKKDAAYFWSDGPEIGSVARLWLFDRVAVAGESLSTPKHVSVEHVREQTGAESIQIERLTAKGVLAQLIYDNARSPAVLTLHNDALELECEAIAPSAAEQVAAARSVTLRKVKVIHQLREAIAAQVQEGLPFDEPKTEEGQQDGKLRQEWRTAYWQGRNSFTFNGDKYSVFGSKGRPRVPQVCVDFVVDTWERLADTRWLNSAEGRGRHVGRIDFSNLGIENRRSVDSLIAYARNKPAWFDVVEFPEAERVAFMDRKGFFQRLFDHRSDFQPGDVVAILGLRDDERLHYHSFIIVDSDPLTGMPTAVAANAGRPRIRSWEAEMQNAPRRSIIARIRPRLGWLEALADPNGSGPTDPEHPVDLQAKAALELE